MDLLVSVAEVSVEGIGRLWPYIHYGIQSRGEKTIETLLEVADQPRESNP